MPVPARLARATAAAAASGGALLLAACSNSEPAQARAPQGGTATATVGTDGVQAVTVDATDQFRFTPSTINVRVGKIRITLHTVGGTPHNLTFDSAGALGSVAIPTTSKDESRSLDFAVSQPGRYRFVCTIHESLNQTGTLNVTR